MRIIDFLTEEGGALSVKRLLLLLSFIACVAFGAIPIYVVKHITLTVFAPCFVFAGLILFFGGFITVENIYEILEATKRRKKIE